MYCVKWKRGVVELTFSLTRVFFSELKLFLKFLPVNSSSIRRRILIINRRSADNILFYNQSILKMFRGIFCRFRKMDFNVLLKSEVVLLNY